MPNSKFRMQDDQESFREVVEHSSLPSFSTDISLRVVGNYGDRLSVPFSDPEAQMNFYCVCLAGDETKYKPGSKSSEENGMSGERLKS